MYVFGEGNLTVESIDKPTDFQVDVGISGLGEPDTDYRYISSGENFYKAYKLPVKITVPENTELGDYNVEVNFGKPTRENSGIKVERVQSFNFKVEVVEAKTDSQEGDNTIDIDTSSTNSSKTGTFNYPDVNLPKVSPWLFTLLAIWGIIGYMAKREFG